jgi:hypothetical protein
MQGIMSSEAMFMPAAWTVMTFDRVKRDAPEQGSSQLDLNALETVIFDIDVTKYVLMVALAVWIYDYFLTFDDEVELFWKRKDGVLIKVLYVMVSRQLSYL